MLRLSGLWRAAAGQTLLRPLTVTRGRVRYSLASVAAVAEQTGMAVDIKFPAAVRQQRGDDPHSENSLVRRSDIVVLAPFGQGKGHASVFRDGTVVAFGLEDSHIAALRKALSGCERPYQEMDPVAEPVVTVKLRYTTLAELDALGYEAPEGQTASYIDEGPLNAVVLSEDTAVAKLPFSLALREHVLVETVQQRLEPVAAVVTKWREKVEKQGTLPFDVHGARVLKAQVLYLASVTERSVEVWRCRSLFASACSETSRITAE